MINYSSQYIDQKDINSVIKTLKSKWLTTGPEVEKFEKNIKKKVNSKFGVKLTQKIKENT